MNSNKIPFEEAFINVPAGSAKIKESDYQQIGKYPIVDQGQKLIAGHSDEVQLLKMEPPYIVFGDHTRIVKYIDFPFIVGADGTRIFKAREELDPEYSYFFLASLTLPNDGYGRHSKYLKEILVPKPLIEVQRQIAYQLKTQLAEVETARQAAENQKGEFEALANALVFESIADRPTEILKLGDALEEVKKGIGEDWAKYPVLGATRNGIALAKEPPGKQPQRYKPVRPKTLFYNPMRILIGSIAFMEEDGEAGITSPDYVVLKGREGRVDSRWFYYWLRSPLGIQCILSLARGAVRERMLFNRLADGEIDLPSIEVQQKASAALATLLPVQRKIQKQLDELKALPKKLLEKAFSNI